MWHRWFPKWVQSAYLLKEIRQKKNKQEMKTYDASATINRCIIIAALRSILHNNDVWECVSIMSGDRCLIIKLHLSPVIGKLLCECSISCSNTSRFRVWLLIKAKHREGSLTANNFKTITTTTTTTRVSQYFSIKYFLQD